MCISLFALPVAKNEVVYYYKFPIPGVYSAWSSLLVAPTSWGDVFNILTVGKGFRVEIVGLDCLVLIPLFSVVFRSRFA
jgi:hypothetical protein